MANKIEKNKLEEKVSTNPILKCIGAIYEISARAELSFLEVLPIYLWTSYKFYLKSRKEKESPEKYNFILDEKAFRLTERFIENSRIKEANRYLRLEKIKNKLRRLVGLKDHEYKSSEYLEELKYSEDEKLKELEECGKN